jgi:hypothetical protein
MASLIIRLSSAVTTCGSTTKSTPLGSLMYAILFGFKILIDKFCGRLSAYCHALPPDKVGTNGIFIVPH